jgi:peptide subunit release factor 1 (eRF1)
VQVAELAVQYFITDNRPNVAGLILAGSADFKTELQTSGLFDARLQRVVLKTVDVSYGGEQGFNQVRGGQPLDHRWRRSTTYVCTTCSERSNSSMCCPEPNGGEYQRPCVHALSTYRHVTVYLCGQAIELAMETLGEVKLVQEKKLLQKFFDEISQDTGKYAFMVEDTLRSLDLGAAESLIVWENCETMRSVPAFALAAQASRGRIIMMWRHGGGCRYTVRDKSSGEEKVIHISKAQEAADSHLRDPRTGQDLEVVDKTTLVEWLADNYKRFGTTLEMVTDRSQEGAQFCRGFGGIGALLRWKVGAHGAVLCW